MQPAKKSLITPIIRPVVKEPSMTHDSYNHSTNAIHRAEVSPATGTAATARADKPCVIRNHVCCEVNPVPRPPNIPLLPQATYVNPRAAARPAHVSKIITSSSVEFRRPIPQCMSPIEMFGESPSWKTPGVEDCLNAAQKRHHRLFLAIATRVCYTRSAARAALLCEWILRPIPPL